MLAPQKGLRMPASLRRKEAFKNTAQTPKYLSMSEKKQCFAVDSQHQPVFKYTFRGNGNTVQSSDKSLILSADENLFDQVQNNGFKFVEFMEGFGQLTLKILGFSFALMFDSIVNFFVVPVSWVTPDVKYFFLSRNFWGDRPQKDVAQPWYKFELNYYTLQKLNGFTVFVHFAQFLTVLILFVIVPQNFPKVYLRDQVTCWNFNMDSSKLESITPAFTNELNFVNAWRLVTWLIMSFFLLSFLFQWPFTAGYIGSGLVLFNPETIIEPRRLRYLEYAFSSTLMLIATAIVFGEYNFWTHVFLAVTNVLVMLLGLFSEMSALAWVKDRKSQTLRDLAKFLHYTSWGTFIWPWIFLLVRVRQFGTQVQKEACKQNFDTDRAAIPPIVWGILFGQLALWCLFGFAQLNQLKDLDIFEKEKDVSEESTKQFSNRKTPVDVERVSYFTEMMFVILSLSAKSFLAWTVLLGVIMPN